MSSQDSFIVDTSGIDALLDDDSNLTLDTADDTTITSEPVHDSPRRVGAIPETSSTEKNYASRTHFFTCHVDEFLPDNVAVDRAADKRRERSTEFSYLIFQAEVCPTTGRRHYQGNVWWGRAVRRRLAQSTLAYIFGTEPTRIHLERTKGSVKQCELYCSKRESRAEGHNPQRIGMPPKQGRRSDLEAVAQSVMEGEEIRNIAIKNPVEFIKFHNGVQKLDRLMRATPRTGAVVPTVYWWFGPTGAGKSRRAFELFGETAYVKETKEWWDGYRGEQTVILDDYRPSMSPFHVFLRILDRYPMRVPVKGDYTVLSATVFVITTTSRPEHLWQKLTEENIDQLIRRLTHIEQFNADGTTTVLKSPEHPDLVYVKEPPLEINDNFKNFNR